MTEISAWQTEDYGVVWGTHDPREARRAMRAFLRECGFKPGSEEWPRVYNRLAHYREMWKRWSVAYDNEGPLDDATEPGPGLEPYMFSDVAWPSETLRGWLTSKKLHIKSRLRTRRLKRWARLVWAERDHQRAIGYDAAHDARHGVDHLLRWAQDYSLRGKRVKAAALIEAARELLIVSRGNA